MTHPRDSIATSRSPRAATIAVFALIAVAQALAATPCTLDRATGTTIDPTPYLNHAYGSRWNAATNRIVFMSPNAAGYYRIFTQRPDGPDGSDRIAVTANTPGLPNGHQGTAYWHPSGRYILFVAQKPDWHGRAMFGSPDYEALPGFGRHDDLWLITADGRHSWQLIHDPNTKDEGILIPIFSPDGKRVAWSARQPGGKYAIQVADFVEFPQPHLEHIRSYQPAGPAYYETGSFTSDSQSIAYTSDQDTHSFWHSQIYRLNLATGIGTRLTSGNDYNEHPIVVPTATGDWIIYMSTRGVNRYPFHVLLGTDWYAMRIDGTGTKRLTTMNLRRKNNPENTGSMQVAGTVAVSPTGTFMLGDVQDSLVKQTGFVRIVHFTCP